MTAVNGITSSWHGPRLATCPSNSVNVTVPLKRFGTPRFLQLLDLTALRLPPILLIELSSCGGRPHYQGRER
jgi:hypothetical protein